MLDFLFGSKAGSVRLERVDLGVGKADVPVADISGNAPGKTLLVTGGTDGDEYAGMAAAYALVDRYAGRGFAGRLVVVPVLNAPGFFAESSRNPLDGKFPKMVGLGRERGTASERLVRWLAETYAFRADAWMDLHGGAITEGVRPFLWLFETGVPAADLLAQGYYRSSGADTVLFERAGSGSKAGELARRGCVYALAESGARGERMADDVARHVAWTEAMMRRLGMLPSGPDVSDGPSLLLRRASYLYAPFDGIWYPADVSPDAIERGMPLGTCTRLDGSAARTIHAPSSGVGLWWKETMAMREGDVLVAVGSA